MDSSPPKPKPQLANAQDFIPEKISIARRRARSVGSFGSAGEIVLLTDNINDGGAGQRLDNLQASQPPAIASSVVFHEDTDLDSLDETDALLVGDVGSEGVGTAQTVAASSSADPKDSNRGDGQQKKRDSVCKLFDEIDELFPHNHEGGKIVSDPNQSNNNSSTLISSLGNSLNSSSLSVRKSLTSSILENLRNSKLVNDDDLVPTDYESLVASANDGTLAQLIAGIEDRYRRSTTLSQLSSMEINFGKEEETNINISSVNPTQGSVASKRESLVGGKPPTPTLNECVDWSSLTKSCKRAKIAFRDEDSGQTVVNNMFLAHLGALIAVLKRHCGSNDPMENYGSNNSDGGNHRCTWNDIKARTIETKRALRFAMICLVPPRVEEDPKSSDRGTEEGQGSVPTTGSSEVQDGVELTGSSEVQDDVDVYQFARRYRQELQEAAVRGILRSPSPMRDRDTNRRREPRHCGLQLPLVEIIIADKTFMEDDANISASCGDKDKHDALIMSKIEREKRTVRILASRLLCNLVTDNPLTAEIILRDVPFSPTPDQVDGRMAGLILEPRDSSSETFMDENEAIFWCDLLDATAKVQKVDAPVDNNGKGKQPDANNSEDREALAAVAAALHNLLTSLEAGESLLEEDDKMDPRENANHHKEEFISEIEIENRPTKHFDVGFEAASNGPLMNALLRNILPAKAVLMQSKYEKEHTTASTPKFKPSTPSVAADNLSDSATEWISLVLERLASRGLLPQMFLTAGGATDAVTPEQVVLASCIRQAVDDYHSALTPAGDAGGFGRRRLSIAVKTSGMSVTTRPHPLWGRAAHHGRDSRTAVPVLLALANEVEEVRLRANALREGKSNEVYDGELNCSIRIIDDICDILAQSLGRHASSAANATDNQRNNLCFIADSRSVLGRETTLISSCCKDLARILDTALARNSGRKAREMELSPQDQQTAIVMVRLIANITYQCCYNQDLLRITPVPIADFAYDTSASSNNAAGTHSNAGLPIERTGLHVVLSATSLSPACFTLREWCIIAIRNAVEGNAANAETVRRLEGNEVMGDTPELQRMGVKVEMDKKGNVHVKRRDS